MRQDRLFRETKQADSGPLRTNNCHRPSCQASHKHRLMPRNNQGCVPKSTHTHTLQKDNSIFVKPLACLCRGSPTGASQAELRCDDAWHSLRERERLPTHATSAQRVSSRASEHASNAPCTRSSAAACGREATIAAARADRKHARMEFVRFAVLW